LAGIGAAEATVTGRAAAAKVPAAAFSRSRLFSIGQPLSYLKGGGDEDGVTADKTLAVAELV
jgi:hypothetical protein